MPMYGFWKRRCGRRRRACWCLSLLLAAFALYGEFGHGTGHLLSLEIEPERCRSRCARDNPRSMTATRSSGWSRSGWRSRSGVESVYARSLLGADRCRGRDRHGIQLDLVDWDCVRRPPDRRRHPGGDGRYRRASTCRSRPSSGARPRQTGEPRAAFRGHPAGPDSTPPSGAGDDGPVGGFTDITDTRPLPGVEVAVDVDRAEAARFGADVSLLGQAVQLLTQGIEIAEYRPEDADTAGAVRVRFPADARSLSELTSLRVPTASGLVPIENFVNLPGRKGGHDPRMDQTRSTIDRSQCRARPAGQRPDRGTGCGARE